MHKSLLRISTACAAFLLLFAAHVRPADAQVNVGPQDLMAPVGDTVSVSVEAGDLSQSNVASYQFTATYDSTVVEVISAETENTLSSGGELEVNTADPGETRVAFSSSEVLGGPGTLVELRAVLKSAGTTAIGLDEARFFDQNGEEVSAGVDVTDGVVESAVALTLPDLQVAPGTNSFDIPVEVGNLTGADATSYQFTLTYDQDVIDITDALTSGTMSEEEDLQFNDTGPGEVKVAFASSDPLEGPGTLLRFEGTTGEAAGSSPLRIDSLSVGGSEIPTMVTEGSVLVVDRGPIAVDIDQAFGDATDDTNYLLVGLPGQVDLPIENTLSGDPGENNDWRAFRDDGTEGSIEDGLVEFDESAEFNFRAGRGFWVLSKNNWTVSQEFDPVPIDDSANTSIDVHPGWNIISNPFGKDVSWSSVQAVNGISQDLWSFSGSFSPSSTFESAQNGQAYYFLNEGGQLEELQIPFLESSESESAVASKKSGETLRLDALVDGEKASSVWVGTRADAKQGRDQFDSFSPPGYFTDATLSVINEKIESDHSLASDVRAAGAEGHTYDLALETESDGRLTLQANGLSDLAADREVRLHNKKNGRTVNLRSTPTADVELSSGEAELALLVGSSSYVEDGKSELVPEKLKLRQYPNPFQVRGQTTIEYSLPEQAEVSVRVYDILGRRVRTLIDGKDQRAGVHTLQWNARNGSGQSVASGVYFARLDAGQTRSIKMVVVE